jgi:hypothetical protein
MIDYHSKKYNGRITFFQLIRLLLDAEYWEKDTLSTDPNVVVSKDKRIRFFSDLCVVFHSYDWNEKVHTTSLLTWWIIYLIVKVNLKNLN